MDEKLVRVVNLSVDCEVNDPVDVKCGGPQSLGFDFTVQLEHLEELKKFIKEEIRRQKLPLLGIYPSDNGYYLPEEKVWTKEKIRKCIKNGY